ncbi:glycosyltransferase family 2 protein [Gonapodya prolifera JEL478]|uniref:Glycosyltransferase family 2 protein n=1 Tax=Gonapodya prolifera (strain JEL478) TaxID=1344416 RepID=A0A139A233_GONPJ|nr:glycosyltransferase family 2 protein [Gonapodya prolifera JEL478]|eukprot:KXS10749.1 glycosyltransferase family 2 protein [Gonapodya prolifera JEL478]
MSRPFLEIFPNGMVARNESEDDLHNIPTELPANLPVLVMQRHRGKRHAMYTGFSFGLFEGGGGVDQIMVTESSTILDEKCMDELSFRMNGTKNCGAVSGSVGIYNSSSLIPFMSSLSSEVIFNMEIAAQSFFSSVTHVSEKLGMYRSDVIYKIREEWIGQKCNFQEDHRHLTNLVLNAVFKTVYTHYATCLTDTPTSFTDLISQQIHSSKSFYGEVLQSICFVSSGKEFDAPLAFGTIGMVISIIAWILGYETYRAFDPIIE